MDNNAILLKLPAEDFVTAIEDALKLYRKSRAEGDLSVLAEAKLAQSSLVQDCLLTQETSTVETRGYGLQGILHWGVNKLSPGGAHSFTERQWQFYNSLFYPYLAEDAWTFKELAQKMMLSERALFKVRGQALQLLALRLGEELVSPREIDIRRQYVIEHRYRALGSNEQKILHLATIFRQPLPIHALQQLSVEAGVANPEAIIRSLIGKWLIQQEEGE